MSNHPHAAKPTPPGWPRISSALFYDDAGTAIDCLCTAFGFECALRIEGEGGRIEHSELRFGDGLIMVSSPGSSERRENPPPGKSPQSIGGSITQCLAIYVDDADAHCELARAGGAQILDEPSTTDYGEDYWSDRSYRAQDPEGHQWWFMQRMRTGKDG